MYFETIVDTYKQIHYLILVPYCQSKRTCHHNLTMIRILILLLCSILYGFSAVTSSRQQDSFYFYPQPQDKDVLEGTSVELRCDVSNRDHITFFWTLDNQRIRNSSRRFQEGSNLRILRVNREDDEGAYSCTAINVTTGVSLRSKTARLTVICKYT